MLREERAAAGRVWLLLRRIDEAGRGVVAVDAARAALCRKGSSLRLCGWRRLRQLLAEGEGQYWTRDSRGRLWLHGPARVAAALGVARLANRPVDVPVAALLGGIGDARAHLYATFHSGRAKENTRYEIRDTNGENAHSYLVSRISYLGPPIARDTLADLAGVSPRSQAAYERRAGIEARSNIALGERVAAGGAISPREQERAWTHGRALFRFKDYRGKQGKPGATYLAWRLPNGYGPGRGHQQRPKGRQKRINRRLADLFTKGMTGNSEARIERRFFPTAAGAMRNDERRVATPVVRRTDELSARSSLITRHSSLVTRHSQLVTRYWPLSGAGRGGVGVWAVTQSIPTERPQHGLRRKLPACGRAPQPGTTALQGAVG